MSSIIFFAGSEPNSDESDDEEMVSSFVPRTFRSLLETPMDIDEAEELSSRPNIIEDAAAIETDRLWHLYDFEWRAFPNPPIPPE